MINEAADRRFRALFFAVCQLFCLFSIVWFSLSGQTDRILLSLVTPFLLCLPGLFQRLMGFRIRTWLYALLLLYALGAMLGHGYKLYYLLPWWDSLLHACGGVVFAMLGAYLPQLLNKGQSHSLALRAVFGLCFSIAVAAVWELFEYGMDQLFAMDMQSSSIVYALHSYLLGGETGVLGHIEDIESVVINGVALPVGGYLDTGIVDTMTDVLVETLGALAFTAGLLLDKDAHPLLVPVKAAAPAPGEEG